MAPRIRFGRRSEDTTFHVSPASVIRHVSLSSLLNYLILYSLELVSSLLSTMSARLQKARPPSLAFPPLGPQWPRQTGTPSKTQSFSLPWGFPVPPSTARGKVMRCTVQVMSPILEEQLSLGERCNKDSWSPLYTPHLLTPQVFSPLLNAVEPQRQVLLLTKPLPLLPENRKPVPISKEKNFSRPFSTYSEGTFL